MLESIFHFDLISLIEAIGYVGLFAIVFAESGLFFGFFLPGDSLLFSAGLLASENFFSIYILAPLLALAAILGDNVGYWFGKKVGPRIFTKEDSFFFHKKHVERTQKFYARFGPKALIIGRFVPVVRTFVPILAGVGSMEYRKFILYNIVGGLLWGVGLTVAGFFLGSIIPNVDRYLLPIVLGIIIVSFIPIGVELYKSRKN